jgi:hypothetical protein
VVRWLVVCAIACSSERTPSVQEGSATPVARDAGAVAAPRQVTHLGWLYQQLCALTSDHKVRCWGDGKATPVEREAPAKLVSLGFNHGLDRDKNLWRVQGAFAHKPIEKVRAFDDSGSQYLVTAFADGKLQVTGPKKHMPPAEGYDYFVTASIPDVTDAVQVVTTSWNFGTKSLPYSCALRASGAIACWYKELALLPPPEILGTQLVVGGKHVCALDRERKVHCWTSHDMSGPPTLRSIPGLAGARTIVGGGSADPDGQGRICVLFEDGAVACAEVAKYLIGDPAIDPPKRIANLPTATALFVGSGFTCAAVRDGGVMCWGQNQVGQLGDGTLMDREQPVRVKYLLDDRLPPAETGFGTEPQSSVEMDWSGLPTACTRPTEARGVRVVSAYAVREPKHLGIYLASYRLDPKRLRDEMRGQQTRLELGLDREPRIDVGTYTYRGTDRSLTIRRKVGREWRGADHGEGDHLELTVLGKAWVCGALHTKNAPPAPIAARVLDVVGE